MKQFACDEADDDHGGVIQRTRGRCYEGGFAEGLPLSLFARPIADADCVVVYAVAVAMASANAAQVVCSDLTARSSTDVSPVLHTRPVDMGDRFVCP